MANANPTGNAEQLKRYWTTGKGALKIRWGTPGDFNRCVKALRKHGLTDPEGYCNVLHRRALGHPPGKGH